MTATDWNTPGLADEYADFRDFFKTQLEHVGIKDFDIDTNIPTGMIRLNPSTDIEQRFTGSSWTPTGRENEISAHMSNTVLHSGVPIGTCLSWLTATAPTNYLILNGTTISRTTYAALFALWSTTFGAGDGSTTFTLPDCRGRLMFGQHASVSPGNGAMGTIFGAINHTHTGPSHTHTVAGHTHDMANHTHTGGAHVHSTPSHTHSLPAHHHNAALNGADINIQSSAAHQHNYGTKSGSTIAGSGGNRALNAASSGANETNVTSNDGTGAHIHANSSFSGRVGNVNSGNNGDGTISSTSETGGDTGSGGATATAAPNTNTTGSTALTTVAGGTADTGTNNPPCIVCNWIVKAL